MINHDYQELRTVFAREGFKFTSNYGIKNPDTILKSTPCDQYASFDFLHVQCKSIWRFFIHLGSELGYEMPMKIKIKNLFSLKNGGRLFCSYHVILKIDFV